MKIRTRLQIIAIFSLAIALVIGLVLFLTAQRVNKEISGLKIADEIAKGVFELNIITYEYLLHHEERMQTQWQLRHDSLTKLLTGEEFKSPERRLILDRMHQNLESLKALFSQLVENYKRRGRKESALSRELEERLAGQLLVKSQAMVSDASQLAEASRAEVAIAQQRSSLLVMVFVAIMAAIIAAVSFMFGRSVVKPIRKLHEGTEIIGAGNLDYRVGTTAKDEIGQLSRAFDEMIGKRKRAEEEVRLLQTITFAISETGDVHSALKIVLQKVCEATGWIMGEAWVPNSDGTNLECSPAWYSRVEGLEKFRKESEKFTFPLGIGLPGRAWSSKKPVWVGNVTLDSNFPRAEIAKGVGLKTAMAIPVLIGDEIVAVMDFFVFEARKEDERLLEIISSVASQLGSLIQRKRAEQEVRVLEEQLRQSQKMEAIGRLAGGIAHDFNNLLTIIKGYSQLSFGELKEGDPLRENIEEIRKAADRAADLTRQLLAFSRRQVMEVQVLDLNTVLKNLDKMLRRMIGEDIELTTLLFEDLGRVKADPGQIEQVIMNLIVNARDAMPRGGKLTIETANVELDKEYARTHVAVTPGPHVMLAVSDTGVGMTPEIKAKIFEPFFTTKEKGRGTGLGLSTVYGIVKQSGGNIWVYSEPGRGTTFKIYLPRVDELAEELRVKVEGPELPRGSETILIVEDDEKVRKLALKILEKQGYEVLEAGGGNEALEICRGLEKPIHVVLADVVMPGMDGRQFAEKLREVCQGFKVLYMSGYTDNTIAHHGILDEGLDFIQKPLSVDGLVRKVREVLDK
ncbi:MAG: ATP-binding protein [Thermodesulfobacteriota bacterium]|nr:ATP-binding protein [Thermodesulfobacteriota bacterium]